MKTKKTTWTFKHSRPFLCFTLVISRLQMKILARLIKLFNHCCWEWFFRLSWHMLYISSHELIRQRKTFAPCMLQYFHFINCFTSVNFYVILALGITVQKGTVFFLSEFLWQRENNSLTQIFQLFLALLGRNSRIDCPWCTRWEVKRVGDPVTG